MNSVLKIRSIISCARRLFPLHQPTVAAKNEPIDEELRSKINELTMQDAANLVDLSLVTRISPLSSTRPLVTFVKLYEDAQFSFGMIALQPKAYIPLHDHPGMSGFIKVVSGRLRVRSFTPLSSSRGERTVARLEKELLVAIDADDASTSSATVAEREDLLIVTPTAANLHDIEALDTQIGGAFFDLLVPPYSVEDGARPCRYYSLESEESDEAVNGASTSSTQRMLPLKEIPEPDFACAVIDLSDQFDKID